MSSSELRRRGPQPRALDEVERRAHGHEHGVARGQPRTTSPGASWSIPESERRRPAGRRRQGCVELGCGTAYFSAWLARRGARPVGVDITPAQLETARQMQREFGLEFPLLEAERGETCPARRLVRSRSLRVRRLDLGAIPTAGSRRRPGCCARAASSSSCATRRSSILCAALDGWQARRLQRPQRGLHRLDWEDRTRRVPARPRRLFRLLRDIGLRRPRSDRAPGATRRRRTHAYYDSSTPSGRGSGRAEEIWKARKR